VALCADEVSRRTAKVPPRADKWKHLASGAKRQRTTVFTLQLSSQWFGVCGGLHSLSEDLGPLLNGIEDH
jgi:hypothetical protein